MFNCRFISDVRTSLKQNTATVLGLVQPHYSRVEKYANEAETVSVFYFSFISPCATGLTVTRVCLCVCSWHSICHMTSSARAGCTRQVLSHAPASGNAGCRLKPVNSSTFLSHWLASSVCTWCWRQRTGPV